ncbi:GNAT family N-acetyltransferase [Paenibacillus sp. PL91]|uniref:GNAT family N-acetyltransferase n=1 Tax=Paenibacillus sp. PL91 TaxID=2729538 RepID=UPI00145C9D00|nr:GNAT family N-acetyltransferase [Paenibacillus sp. PL91]MBC9201914.1 GNAT family N-acetyltransferase [Paenibacillus sp. PL91]
MIVSAEQALLIFKKLPAEMQSFYFHPQYVINDALYKKDIQAVFFVQEKNENIYYHAFHLGKVPNTPYFDIQSPYGYGGPLCVGDELFKNECIENYKKWCIDQSVLIEFIRFHPLMKNEMNYYGQIFENRQTVYIDLTKENLLYEFSTRVRTAIKKAQNSNVTITFSKSKYYIQQFIDMYIALMNKKNALEDYFFNEEYFIHLLQNEAVFLANAENELGQVIGASLFFANGHIAEYHLSASIEEGRKKNVANLLLYEFAELVKKQDVQLLYLGGGTDRTNENPLLFFKRGFSKNEATFKIGKYEHNHVVYNEMKSEYLKKEPHKEHFILYYR